MTPPVDERELALSEWVSARLGLYFGPERHRELLNGVLRATARLGIPPSSALDRILSGEPSRELMDALASELTVGETYFFREPAAFEALRTTVLPPVLARRVAANDRSLRLWSAGCCTGEEPYSIVMLLDQLLGDWNAWNVSVLATDINKQFLQAAARGTYKPWSFRSFDPALRDRYFQPIDGQRYAFEPALRQRVRFLPLNLVEDAYPSRSGPFHELDVVFCRNVLMYFSPETARRVIERLWQTLAPGGFLIVSCTETSQRLFEGFDSVFAEGFVLYQRPHSGAISAQRPQAQVPSVPSTPRVSTPVRRSPARTRPRPEALARRTPRRARLSSGSAKVEPSLLERARAAAGRGELRTSLEACEVALETHNLDPALHYLRATILLELGRSQEAQHALGTAIYLDPDFVLAHFALGHLALKERRLGTARKHFMNVLALLEGLPRDATVPESDGLTAARLDAVARSLLTTIE